MSAVRQFAAAVLALCCAGSVLASETITYGYDALGRLVQVTRTGTVNNGVNASYSYDPADNRTNVTVNDVMPPSFSVNDVSVTEGGNLVFTVTKSGSVSVSYSVNYATANGTATAGSDYTATSGTLTFAASETTKTVTVQTIDDTAFEGNETLFLNLSNATGGATISDNQGVGTIIDNDTPPAPSFAINDVSATEGGTLVFTVTKTGSTSSSFSVNYATANGTATAGSDYTATSGTLTFTAPQTSKTVSIATIDDTLAEGNETLFVNLSNATGGATISDNQGVGTIIDNDAANQPPVTQPDNAGTIQVCTGISWNVVANDTDPEGNYPLSLVGIQSVSPAYGEAWVASSTNVYFQAYGWGGGVQITYIVKDSLGATSTGIMGVNIVGDGCM